MKRLLFAFLACTLVFSLAACGGRKEEDEDLEARKAPPSTGAAAPAPAAPAAAPATGGATITGKVAFSGTPPKNDEIQIGADAYCKSAHSTPVYTQDVVVNPNGTLQWVLVYVKNATGNYPAPSTAV